MAKILISDVPSSAEECPFVEGRGMYVNGVLFHRCLIKSGGFCNCDPASSSENFNFNLCPYCKHV